MTKDNIYTEISNHIKVFVIENEIYISGAIKGETLHLYNIQGILIYAITVKNYKDYTIFQLRERGIYIVTIGKDTIKVRF